MNENIINETISVNEFCDCNNTIININVAFNHKPGTEVKVSMTREETMNMICAMMRAQKIGIFEIGNNDDLWIR